MPKGDYAFEIAASNIRFGEGVTREVGMDFANMGAKKVGVYSDKTCALCFFARRVIYGLYVLHKVFRNSYR
jgi:hydroxyacid-oxoacid transhydrogenase